MKILNFWDFDGTLIDSMLPIPGKTLWAQHHGRPYPHIGWWSKPESLDINVFECKPKEIAYAAYEKHATNDDAYNYILTSRIPKLKPHLKIILDKHDIIMDEILCANGPLNKGERIIAILNGHEIERGETIGEINVWEDRNKEIVLIEPYREYLKSKNIALNIYKIESDATD